MEEEEDDLYGTSQVHDGQAAVKNEGTTGGEDMDMKQENVEDDEEEEEEDDDDSGSV